MNVEKMEQVEQWLLAGAPERRFDMSTLVDIPADQKENWCGTSCCIAGYVYQQNVKFDAATHGRYPFIYGKVEEVAVEALGISKEVGNRLFYIKSISGMNYAGDWDKVTTADAAQAVRNVIDHGEPMWEIILDFSEDDEDY